MEIESGAHSIEYMTHVNLMYSLTKKYLEKFPGNELQIGLNMFTGFFEIHINNSEKGIDIFPNIKWNYIKSLLDRDYLSIITNCELCCGALSRIPITCGVCGLSVCSECFLTGLRRDKGARKCERCSSQYGRILSETELNKEIEKIRRIFS